MRRYSIWTIGIIATLFVIPRAYAQRWESDEALVEAVEYYRAIPSRQIEQFSTPELLDAYIYRSVGYAPGVGPLGIDPLFLLEDRTDLTAEDVLAVLSEIRIGDVNESLRAPWPANARWNASPWAIVRLKDMAEFHGLLDPEQEPLANELLLGFAMRAIEYTVRQHETYNFVLSHNFLLQSMIATLDRAGLISTDLSTGPNNPIEPYIRAFLEHFGITAELVGVQNSSER